MENEFNKDENTDNVNVDDVLEEKEENKKSKGLTILRRFYSLTLAALICSNVYCGVTLYNHNRNKYFSNDNLFSGNSFSEDISEEEIKSIVSDFEEQFGCEIVEANEDEYCLLKAIKDNKYLTNSEKEHFYKYIDLIIDNPYLDKEELYHSLRNVTVHNYLFRPKYVSKSVQGNYNYINKLIKIFDKNNGNTLNHEGIHCIFSTEQAQDLPTYFDEGMTELLNNEYFSDDPFYELSNYPFEISAVKMLCELTSSDTVLKAFTCGDMNIIAEDLASISGSSIDEAINALNILDITFQKFRSVDFDFNDRQTRIDFCDMTDYFDKCIASLDEKDDRRNSYFYNLILVMNIFFEDSYQCYGDDLEKHGFDRKAYFSSKLKQSIVEESANDVSTAKVYSKSSENTKK